MYRLFCNDLNKIRNLNLYRNFRPFRASNHSHFHTSVANVADKIAYRVLKFGLASSVVGGLGYFGYSNDLFPLLFKIPLEQADEDSFDSMDNLAVVILNSKKDYPRKTVELLRSMLPEGVNLYYSVKKSNQEGAMVMVCKGMRKKYFPLANLSNDSALDEIKNELEVFFKPISQEVYILNNERVPEYVSYKDFQSRVVDLATQDNPIILQMFEDSCFLCFLIRPFINSINKHLISIEHPIRIKRLNVELNDFPKGCPVTRATPTFIFFNGQRNGVKWEEFKPQDFVRKLSEVGNLSENSKAYLTELCEKISERFALFGKLAHWLSESQRLQDLMLKRYSPEYELASDEDMYSRSINILMDIDMKKSDNLEENLVNLKNEIESAEKDCIAIAEMLAQEILESEESSE
ncbi:hypothetical protein MACK_002255 [Theileria orientalis]|uniref:Thioredoxin n=1 Tax=Theileria orientalis TaxID=68886 RepID=A0A976MBX1_THEOR|nr:hypothetical protein MACK_002255 [Theileria orientalis]